MVTNTMKENAAGSGIDNDGSRPPTGLGMRAEGDQGHQATHLEPRLNQTPEPRISQTLGAEETLTPLGPRGDRLLVLILLLPSPKTGQVASLF